MQSAIVGTDHRRLRPHVGGAFSSALELEPTRAHVKPAIGAHTRGRARIPAAASRRNTSRRRRHGTPFPCRRESIRRRADADIRRHRRRTAGLVRARTAGHADAPLPLLPRSRWTNPAVSVTLGTPSASDVIAVSAVCRVHVNAPSIPKVRDTLNVTRASSPAPVSIWLDVSNRMKSGFPGSFAVSVAFRSPKSMPPIASAAAETSNDRGRGVASCATATVDDASNTADKCERAPGAPHFGDTVEVDHRAPGAGADRDERLIERRTEVGIDRRRASKNAFTSPSSSGSTRTT